ncbi:MAG: SHOCT domain-containing protein [Trebonia sp.]
MRRRPLLRAAAVGGSAYLAGKHAGGRQAGQRQQDDAQDQQQTVPAPRTAGPQETPPLMADQVNQLADLHKQGVLSDSEFTAAKAKLLST